MRLNIAFLTSATATMAIATVSQAHISMDLPLSRYYLSASAQADQTKQKSGPCGVTGDTRITNASLITTFKPGEAITVTWRETVQHPGHFRIAFDNDGQDFTWPGVALPSGVVVLADNIADKTSATYSQQVTLPNFECSNCTLQLIQVMTTAAPPYAAGDLYFNCADIVLKAAGGATGTGGATSATGGSSSRGGATATGGASATGGSSSRGGATAMGGSSSRGGATAMGGTVSIGGANATGGGSISVGGTNATGGSISIGGLNATGGSIGNGGANATGSASGSGGMNALGGTATVSGGTAALAGGTLGQGPEAIGGANAAPDASSNDAGCSCRVGQGPRNWHGAVLGLLALVLRGRRRRQIRVAR